MQAPSWPQGTARSAWPRVAQLSQPQTTSANAGRTGLRHRIGLRFEAEAEGLTTDAVVDQIIRTTPVS